MIYGRFKTQIYLDYCKECKDKGETPLTWEEWDNPERKAK